jgi:hypothetical protein
MKITPKSQEEIDLEGLLAKGVYDFEVLKAEDKLSKKGNEMIHVKLKVFSGDGYQFVDDYLMEAMSYKLRHFCEEAKLIDKYESGELVANDCIGRCGKVKLDIEPGGDFPAKNIVKDYGEKKKADVAAKGPLMNARPKAPVDDDSDPENRIPF